MKIRRNTPRATAAVALSLLMSGTFVLMRESVVAAGASTITGRAFQDYNMSGGRDTTVTFGTAADVGLADITVSAYSSSGTLLNSTTTAADGTYTLNVAVASGTQVRVEFSLPASGPLSSMYPSFAGGDNDTTVQFVNTGATDVDAAFNVPGEYCQNNPYIAISRLCAGSSVALNDAPTVWVAQYDGGPYDTSTALTDGFSNWDATEAATKSVTGSILGMAWDRSSGRVYNSAYVRRHSEMYESGGQPLPGALFVTTPAGTILGDSTGGSTSFLVDLESLIAGDQFSNSNSAGPGFIPTNATRKVDRMKDGTSDGGSEDDGVDSDLVTGHDGVFEEVGMTGIGDIETDHNGTLWVVSLYDRHLYGVTLPSDGSAPTTMTSWGNIASEVSCTNGEARPFSVRLWRGSLYLGVVCDGSGDFDSATPLPDPVENDNLSFTILKRSIDPAGSFSTLFGPHPLNSSGRIGKGSTRNTNTNPQSRTWSPWTNFYPDPSDGATMTQFNQRPTPLLSEIEFDNDGSMILGFRDRTADQSSTNGSETPTGGFTGFPTIASGDIYRVCRVGTGYATSDYVFEGETGYPACAQQTLKANEGTEYYSKDSWQYISSGSWFVDHGENSAGMLLQVPGFPDVINSAFDPYTGESDSRTTFYSGGIRYFNNSTGLAYGLDEPTTPNRGGGVMFYTHTTEPLSLGGFQKVNGMADIEALCDEAPVQIGNRVWIDTDKDGVQDPGETPVAGVTVHLYAANGTTLLGTAITNAKGEYYFSSNVTEATSGNGDNAGGGLVPKTAAVIKLDKAADFTSGGPLFGYELTTATAGSNTSIDSNATLDTYPKISVAAVSPGQNDHRYDVGFHLKTASAKKVSVGNRVWYDANLDGRQDSTDRPIAGATLTIKTVDGRTVRNIYGVIVGPVTTGADGTYVFDNLPLGQYKVFMQTPPGYMSTYTAVGAGSGDSSSAYAISRNMTVDGDRDFTLDFGFVRSGELPATGGSDRPWKLGLSLLGSGLVLLALTRRRRIA